MAVCGFHRVLKKSDSTAAISNISFLRVFLFHLVYMHSHTHSNESGWDEMGWDGIEEKRKLLKMNRVQHLREKIKCVCGLG